MAGDSTRTPVPDAVPLAVAEPGVAPTAAEERVSLASNWTLVWWRFRKHRLAMASTVVLLGLYAIVLCPDFFSTQDPEFTDARLAFMPVQRPRLFDGFRLSPWVPAVVGKRNPTTLRNGMLAFAPEIELGTGSGSVSAGGIDVVPVYGEHANFEFAS